MALRKILERKEPVLYKVSHPVTSFDEKLHDLIEDMRETLAASGGVGLAAPQIGILRRVVLVMNEQDEVLELVGEYQVTTFRQLTFSQSGAAEFDGSILHNPP